MFGIAYLTTCDLKNPSASGDKPPDPRWVNILLFYAEMFHIVYLTTRDLKNASASGCKHPWNGWNCLSDYLLFENVLASGGNPPDPIMIVKSHIFKVEMFQIAYLTTWDFENDSASAGKPDLLSF